MKSIIYGQHQCPFILFKQFMNYSFEADFFNCITQIDKSCLILIFSLKLKYAFLNILPENISKSKVLVRASKIESIIGVQLR